MDSGRFYIRKVWEFPSYFAISLWERHRIRQKSGFPGTATFWGWFFIAIGSIYLPVFVFAAVSKLLPTSGNSVIGAIQNDRYYYLLVPLTLPVLVVAVYFHWLSMKLFKHA